MKRLLIAAVVAVLITPTSSIARGEDLVNCRFSDGQYIVPKLCDRLRQQDIEDRNHRAEQKEQLRQQQVVEDERRRKTEEEAAERHKRWDLAEQERKKEQAVRQEKSDAEYAKYEQDEARREKRVAEETKSKKERCGEDYGAPKIGMTIERAKDCVGNFKLISQLNRADGVVSTYRSGRIHISVMNGKIGAWNSY